jgi:hypothetical protein
MSGRPRLPHTELAAKAIADVNRQRVKAQKELTEKYRLENMITRAEYLKRLDIARGLATVAEAVVSGIMSSDMPRTVKEDVLKNIASLPLILEEVAHAQSRLAVAKAKKSKAEETLAQAEE